MHTQAASDAADIASILPWCASPTPFAAWPTTPIARPGYSRPSAEDRQEPTSREPSSGPITNQRTDHKSADLSEARNLFDRKEPALGISSWRNPLERGHRDSRVSERETVMRTMQTLNARQS